MPERKLREIIAKWLFTFVSEREGLKLNWGQTKNYYRQEADSLIALIKEAGYVKEELSSVIGTTLDNQPLIKRNG